MSGSQEILHPVEADSGRELYESLKEWVRSLPDVSEAPHRFGGIEFKVDRLEFMHFHGYRHLDIHLSKDDQSRILGDGKARQHRFAPQAGWVTLLIRSKQDVAIAKEVIQLAYKNAKQIIDAHAARNLKENK